MVFFCGGRKMRGHRLGGTREYAHQGLLRLLAFYDATLEISNLLLALSESDLAAKPDEFFVPMDSDGKCKKRFFTIPTKMA